MSEPIDERSPCAEYEPLLGSLCSGVDGLAMGIERAIGARTMWQAEIDPHASKVLASHWSCPNLGDLTAIDWTAVAPVDVMCAGYPCQPFSHAGLRLGENDVRHLWPYVLDAVRVVRPGLVLLENVAGHLSLGFGRVLGDLAEVGYDCRWTCVRASDVGACHRRERVFIAATDAERSGRARWAPEQGREPFGRVAAGRHRQDAAANAYDGTLYRQRARQESRPRGEATASYANGAGSQGGEPERRSVVPSWGDYGPAIRRHEIFLGRPAPDPVDSKGRLSPRFVEWMMMFPDGHVSDVVHNRAKALRCLGNAVLPPVAERACRILLTAERVAA